MNAMFSPENPSRWNLLFAEDSDMDLDFDEGFEEDELHQSKPPSRRPLLWILLLVLVSLIAYWAFTNQPSQTPQIAGSDTENNIKPSQPILTATDITSPLFREDQIVEPAEGPGGTMLGGDATNSQPGPTVNAGEHLTIIDGSYQTIGWVYQVKTPSGTTGWISEKKLKKSS
jgi:hypothetical protein